MPDSPLSGNASRLTSLQPLYCFGIVRRGDLRAAVETIGGDGEVHLVGAGEPVVDDRAALRHGAVDEGVRSATGDDRRMSRVTAKRPGPR